MQNYFNLLPEKGDTAIALGYFDGLHAGHRKVISKAVDEKKNGLIAVCFTFAQSPKEFLTKKPANALMTPQDKIKELEKLGIDHTFQADFADIVNVKAEDFISEILIKRLRAKKLFCGFNYHFGKGGTADAAELKSLCEKQGVEVNVLSPEKDESGNVISSTLIRSLISDGNIKRANKYLCSLFGFCGVIEHGKRLGRELGTPTINQPLFPKLAVPKFGVYASVVTLENGQKYCGVTNVGIKPTVGGTTPLWETWMPEYYGGEIYGQSADVRLLEFIRPEKKFENLDTLKNTIVDNGKTALKIFADFKACKY